MLLKIRRKKIIKVMKIIIITKQVPFFEKLPKTSKKLVLVLVISMLIIDNNSKKIVFKKYLIFII